MIDISDPIVRPVCSKRTPKLGSSALMVASEKDLRALQTLLNLPDTYQLYMSRFHYNANDKKAPVLVGPMMGSPYAAMLLEILHAWGVQKAIFFGWCGSIHNTIRTGDILIPSGALIEEGTSPQYLRQTGSAVAPGKHLFECLQNCLKENRIAFHSGLVWTTDAVFRETPEKVQYYERQGALAVEMELSALFSVGAYHGMDVAGALAVSDELFSMCWQPGFNSSVFIRTRAQLAGILAGLITHL